MLRLVRLVPGCAWVCGIVLTWAICAPLATWATVAVGWGLMIVMGAWLRWKWACERRRIEKIDAYIQQRRAHGKATAD